MKKNVVVVESPAKAETINKYLGSDYTVLASYGHVRDLPAKNGSVDPENGFTMLWHMEERGQKRVEDIAKSMKSADGLILATDPDREGEAISWHVYEVLREKGLLKDKPVKRVVFNEITKKAILKAMDSPRDIDQPLVDAYMARRALDYLVGFTLSPILWRKLPGSRSAGRVQSVALRLICERESEIEDFNPQEYWSVEALFNTDAGKAVQTHLVQLEGQKIDRLGIKSEAEAKKAEKMIEERTFSVQRIEHKKVSRNPHPPFITSTMQQEASRKLGFTTTRTMQTAQKLYEGIKLGGETVGLITYMRTDGVTLSEDALVNIRGMISTQYGEKYLPEQSRVYKSKSKNAQEAHEAIRPTDVNRRPEEVKEYLNEDQLKLYDLIWKRTVASQMENAVLDQASVDVGSPDKAVILRASGSVILFDGFYRLYREGKDDAGEAAAKGDGDEKQLPQMTEGEALKRLETELEQHFTKPPPRYTEASLVKSMEELGIGRPSTYASIIRILQDRNYVVMESRRFMPEDRGRLVTTFLTNFFEQYVQYNFTAELEEKLDDISGDRLDFKTVLNEFWKPFHEAVDGTKDLTITQVLDVLDEALAAHFFPETEDGTDPRKCTNCEDGRLSLKLGRFGAFIGCANYPTCKFTRKLKLSEDDVAAGDDPTASGPVKLGEDPETGHHVQLCKGPYGFYVALMDPEAEAAADAAEAEAEKKRKEEEAKAEAEGKPKKKTKAKKPKRPKPKRVSIPRGTPPGEVTLEQALSLLSLPRDLGNDPESGEAIQAGLGRFGPYVKIGTTYVSLKEDDVTTIQLDRALEVIAKSGKKKINLGEYEGHPVTIQKGRFGHFIQHNAVNTTLPKGTEPESYTLEQAIERIEAKREKEAAKAAGGGTAAKTTKTKAVKKTTKAKKAPAKKKTTAKK